MLLYFITGISGSGKSAIVDELTKRGYTTYDADKGLSKWQNNETGYVHPKSSVKPEARTADFLQKNSWNIPRQDLELFMQDHANQTVFICGFAENEEDIKDLFTARFALIIDPETLVHRLKTRTNNDWGKQPQELRRSLESLKALTAHYKTTDHIQIDATQPIETVTSDILETIKAFS